MFPVFESWIRLHLFGQSLFGHREGNPRHSTSQINVAISKIELNIGELSYIHNLSWPGNRSGHQHRIEELFQHCCLRRQNSIEDFSVKDHIERELIAEIARQLPYIFNVTLLERYMENQIIDKHGNVPLIVFKHNLQSDLFASIWH